MSNYNYNTLCHHGIKGQKWGIRRFQNDDGTLTAEGRKRYGVDESGKMSKEGKKLYKSDVKETRRSIDGDYEKTVQKHQKKLLQPIADDVLKNGGTKLVIDSKLEKIIVKSAEQNARKELIEKYGATNVDNFYKHKDRVRVATNATEAALAIVGVVAASYLLNKEIS